MRRESREKQEPTADFWKLHVIFIVFLFSKICNFLACVPSRLVISRI